MRDGDHRARGVRQTTRSTHLRPLHGDLKRNLADPPRRLLADALDRLGHLPLRRVECLFLLDVEVLRVLPHNHHVHPGPGDAAHGFDRAHVGVQVHLFAERDDRGGVSGDFGRGGADGAEERAVAFGFEGRDGVLWEGGAGGFEGAPAGFEGQEAKFEAGGLEGFEDETPGGEDFFADAVAGDEACGSGGVSGGYGYESGCGVRGGLPMRRFRTAADMMHGAGS